MFQNVLKCSKIFQSIPKYSKVFQNIPEYAGTFKTSIRRHKKDLGFGKNRFLELAGQVRQLKNNYENK